MLRATLSKAFRAPSIPDLYAGLSSTFPTVADPCPNNPTPFCIADGLPIDGNNASGIIHIPSKVGGNPNLLPMEADTLTVGFV